MNKIIVSFLIFTAVSFELISAGTLFEECKDVCKYFGELIEEKEDELPVCSIKFLDEYIGDEWDCMVAKDLIVDMGIYGAGLQLRGKREKYQACIKALTNVIVTDTTALQIMEKISETCKEKFFSIVNYIQKEVGYDSFL